MNNRVIFSILVVALFFVFSCSNDNGAKNNKPDNNHSPKNNNTAADDFQVMPGQSTTLQFAYFDMGFQPVKVGETIRAVYPFKNMSRQSTSILQVAKSCPCITIEYPQGNIQPGQKGEISVTFETTGQPAARHEKIFSVVLEDNPSDPITLRLTGDILPPDAVQ